MRPSPKQAHNVRCLTVVVSYPFHPLIGQSVLVIGDKEHAGMRHLLVRRPDGARILLPEWMAFPHAGAIRILSYPRLCVNRLVELRALLDRLMASSPGGHIPGRGERDEAIEAVTTGPIQDVTARRTPASTTKDGCGTPQGAPRRGDDDGRGRAKCELRQRQSGARQ